MAENKKSDPKNKPVRVQFPKGATSEAIVDAIDKLQNDWAKRHPEKAHKMYPKVWDEKGNRIDGQ